MILTIQPFIFSLSAPFIPQFFKDQLDQTAPYWDYIIGNETEAMSYADSHDLNTHDIPTIAKHLANLPKENKQRKRVAIITQGTDPTIIAVQGEDSVKTFPVHAINKSEINDTNGAGDAFAGGFFAGVVKGESIETCVDMGSWLAALSLRELGPSYVFTMYTTELGAPKADCMTRVATRRLSRRTQPSDRLIEPTMPFQQLSTNFLSRDMIPKHHQLCL